MRAIEFLQQLQKYQRVFYQIMKVSLWTLEKEGIEYFKSIGRELTHEGKSFGWLGEIPDEEFWQIVKTCFEMGFAVKLFKPTGADVCLMLDSNRWRFKQR